MYFFVKFWKVFLCNRVSGWRIHLLLMVEIILWDQLMKSILLSQIFLDGIWVSTEGEWVTVDAQQAFFASMCYPGGLLLILTGIRVSSTFPLQTNCYGLANCGFAAVFDALKLAGLQQLGCIAGEGQCYSSFKNGPSEVIHLATASCQSEAMVRRKCTHAGTWRGSLLLAAGIAISSQATVLAHH